MTTPTSNLVNSSVSLLSNNNEKASKLQKKIREQAKLDVFKNLDLDTRGFTDIAKTISEIKEIKDNPDKKIKLNGAISIKYETLKSEKYYKKIFDKYEGKDDNEKEKMYMEIAERCILARGGVITYKDGNKIGNDVITKDFVKNEYEILNKDYDNKLDFFTVKDKNGKLYIIKWKDEELKKIEEREDELKKEEIERLQKENEKLSKSDTKNVEGENTEELDNPDSKNSEGKDDEKIKIQNEKMKEMEALIKKLMEDSENKDKKIEEQNAKITDLENLLKNKDKKSDEKSEDTDEKNIDEGNDKNDDKLESSEALDENSNYISRSFVEGLIVGIRGAEGYPRGTIRIREEVINIEEFEFYEEFKQEYIEAKGDATILSKLDKEFAEMIILFSPKGADYKDKYCIKLSESELKDGLYVSEERLARYGVMIKVSEYFEKVVEREVIRERKIVEEIETTITELQTQIVELTTSISIERYNKEVILEEIKSKKKLLAILIKRYKALQLSLKGLDSDEELKQLKEDEKKLQKELEKLNKQKDVFNEIKKALDAISADQESVYIITRDGKVCYLHGNGKRFTKGQDGTDLFEESGFRQSELLDVLKKRSVDIKEVIIGEENMPNKPQKFSIPENIEDIDKKIADIEKQLADIKEKIKQKEASNKKRVVVEEFDDSDGGAWFARYCEENGIKRKDGKEISRKGGMDTSAIYVDKNGRELKLEWNDGANQHDDAGSHTKYELVYYEESGNGKRSELETQLTMIIEEWEALLVELTELERKLIIAKTEEEKIEIKKKIKIINKKLVIISQKYTKFEQFIHIYKSKTKITKYSIFQIVPFGPIPVPVQGLQLNSVISDMGTDVFKEKAALKVEEELKRQYDGLGRWQMGSRLALFLGRGSKRKKMMKNEMNNMANTAFQTDVAYATLNDQSQNAADRHAHELLTNMAAVNHITTVHNPQVDQLCRDYLNNRVNDTTFQQRFNTIIAADANIQNILQGQNITHIGTNILLQLKEQRALNTLIRALDGQLNSYIATGNPIHMHNMQNYVEQYIKDYQKLPAFKATFEQFLKGDLNARNNLEAYLDSHVKSIIKMQITNLRMNIDILNKGKSAYQIDNKDREKGWKYKVGHFMDKHPRGTAIGSVALGIGLGVATAPLSAVAGAAVTTGVFGSYVGFTNYVKKWTHHTKEQNTHEKNVVTDYRNEQAKIQNWQNLALNGSGRKKYKAKRQLALYDQTTQENIQLSDQITEYITNLSSKTGALTPNEDNFMRLNLIEGWARLKYYRAMGHNFLASENVDKTEKDMKRLEKAITLGLQKIGRNTNDIEQNMTATNPHGTNITYAVIQNDLKASYDKSLIQFKRERRNLALKYGISTAALSIGTALGMQYLTGTGVFAKGTPPTAPTTTSYSGGTDNFTLSGDDLSNGSVYSSAKSAISGSGAPSGADLTFNYGVGTDGTKVIGSFNPNSKFITLTSDFANTSMYPNLSGPQVTSLQTELSKIMSDPTFISAFKDSDLAKMRAMESLEHFARALNDSARPDLILHFNHTGSIPGITPHTLGERFMTGAIDITTPGKPGTDPVKRGRWLMGVPLFFNTFKKRKLTKDTTDQNFGQGNNQQRPHQPQPNQNQPHNP